MDQMLLHSPDRSPERGLGGRLRARLRAVFARRTEDDDEGLAVVRTAPPPLAATAGAAAQHAAGRDTAAQRIPQPVPQQLSRASSDAPPAATAPPGRGGAAGVPITGVYAAAFRLHERPFSLLPDPDFLYWTHEHRRAFTVLEYGIASRAPITVITGEVGTGKTTLLQALLKVLPETARIGLVSNAQGGRGELLRWVLLALAQPHGDDADYVTLFQHLQDVLLSEYARGNHTVLIIDEAQNLGPDALEELRMLTNINSNKDELLQLILVGQPELRDMVRRPDLTQFAQRVAAAVHLPAMDAPMVRAYIRHRLEVAGGAGDIFAPSAAEMVFEATGGVPRLVNQLCDLCLVYAYAREHRRVLRLTVQQVLDDGVFFAARPPDAARPGPRGDERETVPPGTTNRDQGDL
jgi:type II secretory pathway predicted ATPase ExeA